jgi:hypothetical protein
MKKNLKKNFRIFALLFLGYFLYIGTLIIFSSKEELAKADWGITTLVYWFFCAFMWLGIKFQPIFDSVVHILIERTLKNEE